jgi:hypothetical protein
VERPGRLECPTLRRPGHDLDLGHGSGALADRRPHAVGARIPTTDDDDVLAGGQDLGAGGDAVPGIAPVRLAQEVHGQLDAAGLAARDGQVAGERRAAGQHDRVELGEHVAAGIRRRRGRRTERHALVGHDVEAPIEDPFSA